MVKTKAMKLDYSSDPCPVNGPALGLIVLDTDETIEPEMTRFFAGSTVTLYHSRIPFEPQVTPETLAAMEANIPASTALLPSTAEISVIGYGCTSGATVIGPEAVARAVQTERPMTHVTNPVSAALAAFAHLKSKKIGFLTPYVAEVSQAMRDLIEADGYQVSAFGSFEEVEDAAVARISPQSIVDGAARLADEADFDTLFISCTNLRAASVIAEIEARHDLRVVTSNQALAWHMQKLAGQNIRQPWAGALFT